MQSPRRGQPHCIGSVIAGEVVTGADHEWKYETAWFTGKALANSAKTCVTRAQYTF
jgi:hypothetical protein